MFADGLFNTGGFELVVSPTGADFQNYDGPAGTATDGDSAPLTFSLDAEQMTPGQTVYAPLSIGASVDSQHNGEFTLDRIQLDGKYSGIIGYTIYSGATAHGANCDAAGVAKLTQWMQGNPPLDPDLNALTTGVPSGPLSPILDLVGTTVTGLLDALGFDLERPNAYGLPYSGTGNGPLPVAPITTTDSTGQQHLCIAANLGGLPLDLGTADILNLGDLAPQAAVEIADSANSTNTDPTRVTWIFNGQSTN